MVALVNLSRGDLIVPRVALFGSPRAVAARTRFRRADGVLDGVVSASLVLLSVCAVWAGWERGVDSRGGATLVLVR
jgi:hypothetical protein